MATSKKPADAANEAVKSPVKAAAAPVQTAKVQAEPVQENKKEDKKEDKKPAAKKTTIKKTATKKTTRAAKAAPKKTEEPKEVTPRKPAAAKKVKIFVQYGGREVVQEDLVQSIIEKWCAEEGKKATAIKSFDVYIKPEDNAAYYVINGQGSSIEL